MKTLPLLALATAGILTCGFPLSAADVPAPATAPAAAASPAPQAADALWAKVEALGKARQEWVKEHQKEYGDPATSPDQKKKLNAELERQGAELTASLRAFAAAAKQDDPRFWQAEGVLLQREDEATALKSLHALLDSPAAPAQSQMYAMMFMANSHPSAEVADAIGAYFKAHPDAQAREMFEMQRVHILEKASPDKAQALLTSLAADSDAKVADAAKSEQTGFAARRDLATKPLDLNFKALDGRAVDTAKLRGKVVLIDFWATWCGPCVGEVPNVVAAYKKYHDKGFEIVGISLDKDKDSVEKFVKARGMDWPQYFDGKGWQSDIGTRYGIESIPRMWLLGTDGKVASFDAREDLDGAVAKLLGKPASEKQ